MKLSLYLKFILLLVLGMLALLWSMNALLDYTETQMSFIEEDHQDTLREYAHKAEELMNIGQMQALEAWIEHIKASENTRVAIVNSKLTAVAGGDIPEEYLDKFTLGRKVYWKIHLYLDYDPVIEFRFADKRHHFLIELPQRMRPGSYWPATRAFLNFLLPLALLMLVVHALYRHIMRPLRILQNATKQFASGKLDVRARPRLKKRHDELAQMSDTFDEMAERIQTLVETQRLLIADLSHEMRTPITRLELALDAIEHGDDQALRRARSDILSMRQLAEDSLTLAWLETEKPSLNDESLDLVDLLECLVEAAQFEFPAMTISTQFPDDAPLHQSNHRALGQAIENILRNALRYTPQAKVVNIMLDSNNDHYTLTIADQGPGVPDIYLEEIFKPFFRVEKSRQRNSNSFGLGLSLAKRQVEAVGGHVRAENVRAENVCTEIDDATSSGLRVIITLPI